MSRLPNGPEEEEGSFLPPFANRENKEINAEIKRLEGLLEQTQVALEENTDRIGIMSEHLQNVQQEIHYTQSRVEFRKKELHTEEHLKQLSQREVGRLKIDIDKLQRQQLELRERALGLQKKLQKGQEIMDRLKNQMVWDREEYEQWAIAARQKEEDNEALEGYSKKDDGRVKELNLLVERAAADVGGLREQLGNEVTETQAAQIQLDKTAEDFKAVHQERAEMVKQWEEALETVRRRDEAIQMASERFADKKSDIRRLKGDLDAQSKFLEAEAANNRELDARIGLTDREVAKLRESQSTETKRAAELNDELEIVRNTLRKVADELEQRRTGNGNLRSEIDRKSNQLEEMKRKLALQERKLEDELNALTTLEEKSAQLAKMQQLEERRLVDVEKEVAALKDRIFRASESLFSLRQKERNLIAEILGGQNQYRNLETKIGGLDQQVLKQQELLYHADFQIQLLERKVARAGGERSDEEKRALNARIEKLSLELEAVNAEHTMLSQQVKKAEDDLLRARRRQDGLRKEQEGLDSEIGQLQLECEETARAVRAVQKEKEDKLVSNDLMKVEVSRLRTLLGSKADEVFSLENKKIQLQLSMEERRQEVSAHKEALSGRLRLVQDDIHRLTLEVKERELRVGRLEAKFDVVSKKNRPTNEAGEEVSQAYFVIKAAQEREELQQEGDELDGKIKKAEKEVRALESTLARLNDTNSGLRGSYRSVDSKEAERERAELRARLDRAYDKLKFRRNTERSIRDDIQQADNQIAAMYREEQSLNDQIRELGTRKQETEYSLLDQKEKTDRAQNKLDRLCRDVRARAGPPGEGGRTVEELVVESADARDVNRAVIQELRILASDNPGAGIAEQLEAAGLKLPANAGPGGAGGSRGSSVAGSRPGSAKSDSSRGSGPGRSVSQRVIGQAQIGFGL